MSATESEIPDTVPSLKKEFDVVVIGEINADLILRGNVRPQFGQVEQLIEDASLVIGSSSAIFACGAARLGLRTTFIGKVGDDLLGEFMVDSLHSKGVDTSGVIVDKNIRTGLTVILAEREDRAILTYLGSIPALRHSEIDYTIIDKCRHLHLGSYFMLDALRPDIVELYRRVKGLGLSISMDTNYDPAEKWNGGLQQVLEYVDILMINEREAKAIAGIEHLEQAMQQLVKKTPLLAVKLGERGAVAERRGEAPVWQTPIAVSVVDTVGAGDSFDAGFIYGYLNDWSLKDMLSLAVVCGSLSTRSAGGTDAQADLQEASCYL